MVPAGHRAAVSSATASSAILPPGADLMPAEAVGEASRLHLVVAGGGGVQAATGFDDGLVEPRTVAAREMLDLAAELERALADPDLRKMRHRLVGSHEQIDLVVERDLEGIAYDRRQELADQRRGMGQPHWDAVDAR
jgi:hypothetical protein